MYQDKLLEVYIAWGLADKFVIGCPPYIVYFLISSRLQPDQKRMKREANATEELVSNSSGSNVVEATSKGWYYTLIYASISNVPFSAGNCSPLSLPENAKL